MVCVFDVDGLICSFVGDVYRLVLCIDYCFCLSFCLRFLRVCWLIRCWLAYCWMVVVMVLVLIRVVCDLFWLSVAMDLLVFIAELCCMVVFSGYGCLLFVLVVSVSCG